MLRYIPLSKNVSPTQDVYNQPLPFLDPVRGPVLGALFSSKHTKNPGQVRERSGGTSATV